MRQRLGQGAVATCKPGRRMATGCEERPLERPFRI